MAELSACLVRLAKSTDSLLRDIVSAGGASSAQSRGGFDAARPEAVALASQGSTFIRVLHLLQVWI